MLNIGFMTIAVLLSALGLGAGAAAGWISFRLPGKVPPARPRRYVWLPLLGALIGFFSAWWCQWRLFDDGTAIFTALLGWQLMLIALIDAENFWLPDVVTVPLALTGLLANVILPQPPAIGWMLSVLSALAAFGGLWLLAGLYQLLRKRRGMGTGDPILLGAGAAWVGLADVPAVLLWASLSALLVLAVQRVRQREVRMDSRLPFGTFLALGIFVCWLPL